MVDAILNSTVQPTDLAGLADHQAPGFEHAIGRALKNASDAENSPEPAPRRTSTTGTPESSKSSKLDEPSTLVVPILLIGAPPVSPQTAEPSRILPVASDNIPAATEQASTVSSQSETSASPIIRAEVMSTAGVAARDLITDEEVLGSDQLPSTQQQRKVEVQSLSNEESTPSSLAPTEAPKAESGSSDPLSVLASPNFLLPTKIPNSILRDEGSRKSEVRTQKNLDIPFQASAPPSTAAPGSQSEKNNPTSVDPNASPEKSSTILPETTEAQRPHSNGQTRNTVAERENPWGSDNANHGSAAAVKDEAHPHLGPQQWQVNNAAFPTSADVPLKESMPAAWSTSASPETKGPLPEFISRTDTSQRVKTVEVQLDDPPVPGAVHLLSQSERQEMRFTWNTPDFGHIEVRTTVDHDRIGAVVAAPDATLRESLRSDLDSLNRALGQHSLELGDFHTSDSGANTNSGGQQESNTWAETPAPQFRGFRIHAPALYRREIMHAGVVDLRA